MVLNHSIGGYSNMLGNKEIMAKNIRYYMESNGKTRIDVCHDLGFAYSTFTDWLNAKKYPRIDKIEMMANYFHISKSDLVEDRSTARNASGFSSEESLLFTMFSQLNQEGREKVLDYISDLIDSGKYKKYNSSELVEEA
jgi:transcriptional regulator with XRE-family HTH domain